MNPHILFGLAFLAAVALMAQARATRSTPYRFYRFTTVLASALTVAAWYAWPPTTGRYVSCAVYGAVAVYAARRWRTSRPLPPLPRWWNGAHERIERP